MSVLTRLRAQAFATLSACSSGMPRGSRAAVNYARGAFRREQQCIPMGGPWLESRWAAHGARIQHRRKSSGASAGPGDTSSSRAAELINELARDPKLAAEVFELLPQATRSKVGVRWAMAALEDEFASADINRDGKLSFEEFQRWGVEVVQCGPKGASGPATPRQLLFYLLRSSLPFVAFGMVDNGLMVLTGEAIDRTLGMALGISTMAAAALGNAASNGVGMCAHGLIERTVGRLGIPNPRLTLAQARSAPAQALKLGGGVVGVVLGCILGMFPLLFMDSRGQSAE